MLGTIDNVRALSGWPTEDEVPDGEIEDALDATAIQIVTMTGVSEDDWDIPPNDVNKLLADETCEICTASKIALRVATIDKSLERTKQLQLMCQTGLQSLREAVSTTMEDNPSFIDVDSEYTTHPLNPNVDPYDPLL